MTRSRGCTWRDHVSPCSFSGEFPSPSTHWRTLEPNLPIFQFHRRLLRLLDGTHGLLEEVRRSDHGNGDPDAVCLSLGRWRHGTLAHRRVLREGEGRWRGVLPAMDFGESQSLLKDEDGSTNSLAYLSAPARQHPHFLRLVLHRGLGRSRLVSDRRNFALRIGRLSAKWTREGGAAEPAVLDARVPAKAAAPVSLRWIPPAPDVSGPVLPRVPVRALQLLDGGGKLLSPRGGVPYQSSTRTRRKDIQRKLSKEVTISG